MSGFSKAGPSNWTPQASNVVFAVAMVRQSDLASCALTSVAMTKSWTKPNTDDPLFQQVEGEFWGAEYAVGLIEPVANDSQGLIGSEALAHVEKGLNERLAF